MGLMWNESIEGFIADTPNIDFYRCDGAVFSFDKVNTASSTFEINGQDIHGGQYRLPIAHIDTDMRIEFSFESSAFTMEMFEAAYAQEIEVADTGTVETKRFDVGRDGMIQQPFEVAPHSVSIRGLEEAASVSSGHFVVDIIEAGPRQISGTWEAGRNEAIYHANEELERSDNEVGIEFQLLASMEDFDDENEIPLLTGVAMEYYGRTYILFDPGDVGIGDTIRVSYRRRTIQTHRVVVTRTSTSSKGSLTLHMPVYSSGADCTQQSIIGWLHIHFYRVRVTQQPGINASYKSASTFGLGFQVIEPGRLDGALYEWDYEALDEDGSCVNVSSNTIDWK